jgi:hypothetical protein
MQLKTLGSTAATLILLALSLSTASAQSITSDDVKFVRTDRGVEYYVDKSAIDYKEETGEMAVVALLAFDLRTAEGRQQWLSEMGLVKELVGEDAAAKMIITRRMMFLNPKTNRMTNIGVSYSDADDNYIGERTYESRVETQIAPDSPYLAVALEANRIRIQNAAARRQGALAPNEGTTRSTTAGKARNPVPRPRTGRSSILLEAGLVFKSGDVRPVARTTFYLLDDNPGKIMSLAGLSSDSTGLQDPYDGLAFKYGLSVAYADLALPEYANFRQEAAAALKPNIVQTVITDFTGKARITGLAAGTYYLLGVYKTPKGIALWNFKVRVTPGQTAVTLDQNNAAVAM